MDLTLQGYASRDLDAKKKALLEHALVLDPANVPALLALSFLGDDAESERLTQRAVTSDPLCADSWTARGQVLWQQGQFQAARDAVNRALSMDPSK